MYFFDLSLVLLATFNSPTSKITIVIINIKVPVKPKLLANTENKYFSYLSVNFLKDKYP